MANNKVNPRNMVCLEGRVVSQPVIKTTKDGSRKVLMTLGVQDNFLSAAKDGSGERVKNTQFIGVQGLLTAKMTRNGVYACIDAGDLIAVGGEVRTNNYEKNGEMVYDQVLLIQTVDLKETKQAKAARQARKAADAQAKASQAAGMPVAAAPATEAAYDHELEID